MSLIVDQIIGYSYSCQNVNKTKKDFINILPDHIFSEIFSHLNIATLGVICCVSKKWKQLVSEPIVWKMAIYREIAFGNDKWAKYFGEDVVKDEDNREELFSLPADDFITDCKKFKAIFPETNVKDTLMLVRLPKTLNGGLTLKSLGLLARTKRFVRVTDTGYRFFYGAQRDDYKYRSIDKSQWVLMTKNIIPESVNKSYVEQQKVVADLAQKSLINYEVPGTLEAVTCIYSELFKSNTRLFHCNTKIYMRCNDIDETYREQEVIGGFGIDGIRITKASNDHPRLGVAAMRKF
ncbi:F-box domain-containing protein (plasmid) [Candidatus Protochlamydia naegleriophila]|uniref:F-box domain-containing protein n=1 Tax=Candidatus Protochlamydia naegleriophila TaxID=389348 RepID=A0A0U5JHT1_9BACT|nr:F-box protein [Candidatus Protochlamydia naegleriophila]CUI18162.1 F-box domain-containing protein [Candidatus Protochlamydia naegleriophila]